MRKRFVVPVALALSVALVTGCALPDAVSPASSQPEGKAMVASSPEMGNVEIRVTDAPREDNVSEIWVKVSEVQVHRDTGGTENGWMSANITGPNPFELLALKNGGIQSVLGNINMTAGNYTQIRLMVDSVQVKIDGVMKDASVPSGKVKFVHPFEVVSGETTVLLFDFDADKSVNVTGGGNGKGNSKILVKPVIKLTSSKPSAAGPQPTQPDPDTRSLKITTPGLPNGASGVSYNATVQATGGTAPFTWTIMAGSLPGGLSINTANGEISGVPTVSGNFTFRVRVTDNYTSPKSDAREFTMVIAPQNGLIILTTVLPDGTRNAAYGPVAIQAIGGTPPHRWSLVAGTIPQGLTFNLIDGVISGTPTNAGNHHFTVQVSDNLTPANTFTQALSLRVQ